MSTVEQTMSPEDYATLCKLRAHARDTEEHYLEAAEESKRAKKSMEAAQDRVNKFLDEMESGPMPLEEQAARNRESGGSDPSALFADDKPANGELGTVPVSEEPGEFAVIAEDERWRSVPIDEIGNHGIKPSLVKRLKDAGIATVGDLADYSTADRDLTSISGIGQTSKDEIVDAMISYFESNPMPPKPQVVENPPGSPQSDSQDAGDENDLQSSEGTSESRSERPTGRRRKKSGADSAEGLNLTPEDPE